MTKVFSIPGIGQIIRPPNLTCSECGDWLENAIEYATCPHGHGKLKPWIDNPGLKIIRNMKLLEGFAEGIASVPVVSRISPKRKQYLLPGCDAPHRIRRIQFTAENLSRGIRLGWIVAQIGEDGPLAFVRRIKVDVSAALTR